MGSRNFCFALAVALLQLSCFVRADGHYSVVGPGTLRSNSKYNAVVSVHKTDKPCEIKVSLMGPSLNETKTITVEPLSSQNVEFEVPRLESGDYNLTVVGTSGMVFENSTKLNFAESKPSVFVQTDKATYKPGDLVQYRVLFLDENTRPAKIDKPISIEITDGASNLIKQMQKLEVVKGVYTGKLQLSEQPVLGDWRLGVKIDGSTEETKTFEVAKYVLPKFEVTVDTAPHVPLSAGMIKVTVRAKYTYGKSVKGKATVSVTPANSYYGRRYYEPIWLPEGADVKTEKTIDVDGKGHAEFDLHKDLHVASDMEGRYNLPSFKVFVQMEEALTGDKQNGTAEVRLHTETYTIDTISSPTTFKYDEKLKFKVAVKNWDKSPVRDSKVPAKLIIGMPSYYLRGRPDSEDLENSIVVEQSLDDNGIAEFETAIPTSNNYSYLSVRCQYKDTTTYLPSLSKFQESAPSSKEEDLSITVNTEKPQLGKDISIEVSSKMIIPYFVYTIVGRGQIIRSEHVDVPNGRKSHTFKVTPSFEMVPQATIYVHFVSGDDLYFDEKTIEFGQQFENHIDIEAPVQTKPGESVTLNVNTDPESFVGLLGVDQSVLLLKSGNDLDKSSIFGSLNKYSTSTPWMRGYGRYPGEQAGLVTMTNANYPYNTAKRFSLEASLDYISDEALEAIPESAIVMEEDDQFEDDVSDDSSTNEPTKIRRDFSDVWIWYWGSSSTEGDNFSFTKNIPDTITSWVVTGFSLNPKSGLALTENPSKIQVFQPFFVSTHLPYSVKRGEVISVPVIIFNYMDKALEAEVTMDNEDKEFDFVEASNEVEEVASEDLKRVKRVAIPSNSGQSVSFMIRPRKVGAVTLKITAVTPLAGDAIHQTLKVEPEGVTKFENKAAFVNLNEKSEHAETFKMEVPENAVEDSEFIEFTVVGDLLGPTVQNLDQLVRMPYGCGEQNMVNFVPNILVMKYLETIKKEMPSVMERAKKFMDIGYQRELTYKHDDGSYSAFGKSDGNGSTWLTGYVMRSFLQARKYVDVDTKILDSGFEFLASQQAPNGSFPEYGRVVDFAHHNELGLTSFVLFAFLEDPVYEDKYRNQVAKAIDFVVEQVQKTDDLYSMALAVYALQKAKHAAVDEVLAKLDTFAKEENNRKWWSKEDKNKKGSSASVYWHPSKDVEITAYVLSTVLETKPAAEALPIVKYLISKRNSNGGFASTQDTVVGLSALIAFAEKAGSGSEDMSVEYTASGKGKDSEEKGSLEVNKDNALVLQTHVLPKSTRQVEFTAKGKGSAMVQLSYRYNVDDKDKKPSFKVTTKIDEEMPPEVLLMDVCSEFVPLGSEEESNMAVIEVALPSGYVADSDSFDKIEAVDRVKRTETKNSDSVVIVYFDGLPREQEKCIPVRASRSHAVAKQKPASVSLYDYYEPERRATEYYEVKSSLCDICDGDDCGKGCPKV